MYRPGQKEQSQNDRTAAVRFVNLVENQPIVLQPAVTEGQVYKSLLTGRQIISHIKSLLLPECDNGAIDSRCVMLIFYKALQ